MQTINLRMMRRGRAVPSVFTERFRVGGVNALSESPWSTVEGAVVYYGQIFSNEPKWLDFLKTGLGETSEDLFTGGAGAAIFLPVDNRIFVVCFGHIHIALEDDAFERGFGLRVVLNCVPRGNLRSLDLATPDAVTFQKRVQASRNSDLQDFGVDMLRDLARVAGGAPADASFAKFAAGKDSLSLTCRVDARSLADKCEEVGRIFRKRTYRNEFGWVDNLRTVNEEDVLSALDEKLFGALEDIRQGRDSELHMAPPEIVNYTEGSLLHYNGFGSHGVNYHSLSIEDYARELNEAGFSGGIGEIKRTHKIGAQNSDGGGFSQKWRVYDCFVFEATLGFGRSAKTYVLFSGEWYRVEKAFKQRVERFFNDVEKVQIVGSTTCANERELIAELDAGRDDLYKLDQVKINPEGVAYAFIEPCDFLSSSGDFIHLKDGHSSGPISHLWAQGLVSADGLVSDGAYRDKLKSQVSSRQFRRLLPGKRDQVDRSRYRVVFGIMRKPYSGGEVDLPFFSKVSFQSAAEKIQKLGFKIAIELIQKPASDLDAEDHD